MLVSVIFKTLASVAGALLSKLLTDKFLIRLFVRIGEYLVKKTKNDLDDKVMGDVREALKDYL